MPESPQTSSGNHLASLDGLRALSILLVIVSHCAGALGVFNEIYVLGYLGHLGVSIFFVISGLLITWLMIREREKTGTLSLRDFYIRRALRILPVFWLFLSFVIALKYTHVIVVSWIDLLRAFTFTRNYPLWVHGKEYSWWLNHIWSLSLEEQFYLVWPSMFVFLPRKTSRYVALVLALSGTFLRIGSYYLFPSLRGFGRGMFHTSIDILMMGCVAAFLLDSPVWLERIRKVPTNAVLVVSAVFLFGIEPYVLDHFAAHTLAHSVVDATMPTFEGGMIAASILVLVAGQGGFARNVLNRRPVMHVGKLSYSIYLWQQFFFASGSASNLLAVLWRIPVIYVIGLCSFNLVEKPFLKLRKRFRRVATD